LAKVRRKSGLKRPEAEQKASRSSFLILKWIYSRSSPEVLALIPRIDISSFFWILSYQEMVIIISKKERGQVKNLAPFVESLQLKDLINCN
jgi:hypothetical protein